MVKPIFSIITVTLNNLNGLHKTLNSIKQQTSKNYEWIIIDGASNDGTQDFLDNQNISYISEKDNGIYDAMNKGIHSANGEYLLFLNAGDILENNNTLSEVTKKVENQPYDFIYGDSVEEIDDKKTFKRARPHTAITQGMFTHHQAMLYSANTIKNLRYNERYKIAADYDLTWRVLKNSKDILYIPLLICIFEAGGISQQQVFLGRKEQFKIRQDHGISIFQNSFIFVLQTAAYLLRRCCPPLYWFLKRR